MRALGYIPDIYDEPPFEDFWLFELVRESSNGTLTEMRTYFDMPAMWLYAIADKTLKRQEHQKQKSKKL